MAMIEHDQQVGGRLDRRIVGGGDYGPAIFLGELTKHVDHRFPRCGIKTGGWLIRKDDLWVRDEGARNGDALLLAPRKKGDLRTAGRNSKAVE